LRLPGNTLLTLVKKENVFIAAASVVNKLSREKYDNLLDTVSNKLHGLYQRWIVNYNYNCN